MNTQYAVTATPAAIATFTGKRLYGNEALAKLIELPYTATRKVGNEELVLLADEDGKAYTNLVDFATDFELLFDGMEAEEEEAADTETAPAVEIDFTVPRTITTIAELKAQADAFLRKSQRAPIIELSCTVTIGKERNEKGTKKWIAEPRKVTAIVQKIRVKWLFTVVEGKMLYVKSMENATATFK